MTADEEKIRLYTSLNSAALAVHMVTAADQVLVIARHDKKVTINALEEANFKNLMEIETLLVNTLNHVRTYRRKLKEDGRL